MLLLLKINKQIIFCEKTFKQSKVKNITKQQQQKSCEQFNKYTND